MRSPSEPASLKPIFVLKQPAVGRLIRELRQLTETQPFAVRLGVTYRALNRRESRHLQPSPLALRQVHSVIDPLIQAPSRALREGSEALLSKYFLEERGWVMLDRWVD